MAFLTQPPPLRQGDRVRLVAASSALSAESLDRLAAGVALLTQWGLVVESFELPQRRWGYLAGPDHQRAADLQLTSDAPADGMNAVRLWACVRGGWGAARLLEIPDLALGAGWLLGFSDVTTLLWARLAQGRGGAVHGPMLTSLAGEPPWSQERLRRLLFGEPLEALTGEGWQGGVAEGPLVVANLTVATHLLATPYLPDLRGAILVLEDVGEAPYRLDRLLTHWRLTGLLQQLAGLGLGRFEACDDPEGEGFSSAEVLRERTADLGIPVVAALPVGHGGGGNAALPLGVRARLDAVAGRLSLAEPA